MKLENVDEYIADFIGWDLSKALDAIRDNGWQAEVNFSYPVKGKPAGRARVIRLTRVDEKKVAVVAASSYGGREVT